MKALIANKWELPIIEGKQGGFFSHLNPRDISKRVQCIRWLFEGLPTPSSATEYFGGIGVQSTLVRKILAPREHYIFDIDLDCVEQLDYLFGKVAKVSKGDAKELMLKDDPDSDLVLLDFPNMTARHFGSWGDQFHNVFRKLPEYVTVTDIAYRYLHLHKPLYSTVLEKKIDTVEDYINATSKYFRVRFDYNVEKAAVRNGACYLLLSKNNVEPQIQHFKDPGDGFRFIE